MSIHAASERRPTIVEVAKLAGVSHQTVSRYLRFDGEGLKPTTRASVESAISQLDYRPNLLARSMRTRVTGGLQWSCLHLPSTLRGCCPAPRAPH